MHYTKHDSVRPPQTERRPWGEPRAPQAASDSRQQTGQARWGWAAMHRFKASTLAAACPSATGPDSREAPGAAAERCRAGACALKLVMYCVRGSAGDGERDSSRPRFLPGQKCPSCVHSDTQPGLVATPRLSGSAHQRNAHQGVSRKRPSSSYDGLPRRDALHTERTGSGSGKHEPAVSVQ